MKKNILTTSLICITLLSSLSFSTQANAEVMTSLGQTKISKEILEDTSIKVTNVAKDSEGNIVFSFSEGTSFTDNLFVLSTSTDENIIVGNSNGLVIPEEKVKELDFSNNTYYVRYLNYSGLTGGKFEVLADVTEDLVNIVTEGNAVAPEIEAPHTVTVTNDFGLSSYFLTGYTTPNTQLMMYDLDNNNQLVGLGYTDCNGEFIIVVSQGQAVADKLKNVKIDAVTQTTNENGLPVVEVLASTTYNR